jgi:Protein of unknown function (DUF1501)
MLTITGTSSRTCDGVSRRSFLKIGALGVAGLTLPDLLRARAAAQSSAQTAAILIWCNGGPSHFETYDPKPGAPTEYRGPFKPIRSNVPGMDLCEILPRHARVADRFAIIRSCAHRESGHGSAVKNLMSGYPHPPNTNEGTLLYPSVGSIVARMREQERHSLPPYVCVPSVSVRGQGGGESGAAYLGAAYDPYGVDPVRGAASLQLPRELSARRLKNRKELLSAFDHLRRDADASGMMEGMDAFTRQAFEMVTGKAAREALDLSKELAQTRERYGRFKVEKQAHWGQGCLLARRLVEAGVSFVTVILNGWDDHGKLESKMKQRAAAYDAAVAGLVEDLHERGLDKKVAVLAWGEFGRTPRVNKNGGRDHWPSSMSVLMAGGGLKVGQVIGSTNDKGERPKERPLHPNDVLATIYRHLGIDPSHAFLNNAGRPVPILPHGKPIAELL